ncbi:unnamed protein product [Adineta ricciae]|uniref:Ras GTPase-activating protein n=1 Tax=Adineta ricciae TaxID=249248 RepID=A0A815HTW2_ADIRI|nr:unnamed protein product [Adineta ricciae]CAF1589928.1 unnamed protein product [Adineta ricciae]
MNIFYSWLDVSNNLEDERHWSRKYVEFNERKRTLTFHPNECIRSINNESKQVPTLDLNCDMSSISSSSSTSSLYKTNERRSSFNILQQSNNILPTLAERMSPSLSKTILSPLALADDKIIPVHPISVTDLSSNSSSIINTSRQSRIKFSNLFGRSSNHTDHSLPSLKRAKSTTKLERQKNSVITQNQLLFPNIPSIRSQSHESLFVSNGPLGAVLPSKPIEFTLNNCHIRRLHPSILPSSDFNNNIGVTCLEIRNKNENKLCYLRTKENSSLLKHLQRSILKNVMNEPRIDNSLDIWILEGKGLPTKKKYCIKIFLNDDIYGKTAIVERRDELFWGENFIFKDLREGYFVLRCEIYIERYKQKQYDMECIGSVDISLSTITGNQFTEQWYSIQMMNTKEKLQDSFISLRIKAKYQSILILPIELYSRLEEYIHVNYLRLIESLESNISLKDKDEIATSLTRISHSLSYAVSYLVDIIQTEIDSTSDNSLTFRGNSIATKSMESFMKLVGKRYLREVLSRFITDVISLKTINENDFEVDPDRLLNINNLEKNQSILKSHCEYIWSEIQKSHLIFPHELKCIFSKLRQASSSEETIWNFLSGSVFLRFICPAILSPNLFDLTQEYPNEKISRRLTLIAKTLQTLANFTKFGSKEPYMKFMNDFIAKESDNMRKFLLNIATIDSYETTNINEHIDLGREYAILHMTLVNLFEELNEDVRRSLNELESILKELSARKIESPRQIGAKAIRRSPMINLYQEEKYLHKER